MNEAINTPQNNVKKLLATKNKTSKNEFSKSKQWPTSCIWAWLRTGKCCLNKHYEHRHTENTYNNNRQRDDPVCARLRTETFRFYVHHPLSENDLYHKNHRQRDDHVCARLRNETFGFHRPLSVNGLHHNNDRHNCRMNVFLMTAPCCTLMQIIHK